MTINYESIGNRVRENRLLRGITQAELAERTGLCNVYISYIENGVRKPRLDAFLKIVTVFGISFDSLLFDAPPIRRQNPNREWMELVADCNAEERELLIENARSFKMILREKEK